MGAPKALKWNRRSLLLACEELLTRPDTVIKLQNITLKGVTAKTSFNHTPDGVSGVLIIIDPRQSGQIEATLHELLHVLLVNQIRSRFNMSLEEVLVRALERELWFKGFKPKDTVRWKGILDRKIGGGG